VLVVKTLGRQDQEVARFAEAAAALREERIAVGRLRANYSPIIYSLPNLGILVLLLVGTWLFSQGTVTLGEMVRAMALFSILSLPMEILGFLFQMIPQSVVAQDRINEVLAVAPESTAVGGVVGSATVDFVDLSFAYPTEGSQVPLVLEGLSLHIDPGEPTKATVSPGSICNERPSNTNGTCEPSVG
jgi:ABC-type multidrug transport system fused ATPase/permease subunit